MFVLLNFDDIVYVEGSGNYVNIFTVDKRFIWYKTLPGILEIMPPSQFMRVHKSLIVGLRHVDAIRGNEVMVNMKLATKNIPIGKTYKDLLLKNLGIKGKLRMRTFLRPLIVITALLLVKCSFTNQKPNWEYPLVEPHPVVEDYYGQKVTDEFRFIENIDSAVVKEWMTQQQNFYSEVMCRIVNRNTLVNEIDSLISLSSIRAGHPRAAEHESIFFRRIFDLEGVQKLIMSDSSGTKEVELFSTGSINSFKNEFNIDYFEPSWDGKLVAIGISSLGDEMSTLQIIDVKNKSILPDKIQRAYSANPSWLPDNSVFFIRNSVKRRMRMRKGCTKGQA